MALRFSNKHSLALGKSTACILSAITLASMCFYLSKAPISLATKFADTGRVARPFTLETAHYSFQNDRRGKLANREITARRSDGATVKVETMLGGRPLPHGVRMIRYLDGHSLHLNDAIAAKTTWPAYPTREPNPLRVRLLQPPPHCVAANWEFFLRHDAVLGHPVEVVSESFTTTAWKAPELGCETVQYRIGYKHAGVYKLEAETKAISLQMGEPDPRLFDEGASYTEMRPSEMSRRAMASEGLPWDHRMQEEAARDDKLYLAAH